MQLMAGRLVTETLDYDGGRAVTAYVPPTPPEAIVFAGDGQVIAPWGTVLEAAGLPSTMDRRGASSSRRDTAPP